MLQHVDTSKHSSSCGASSASPRSADSTAGMYISMQQNLYERAPMVSIVWIGLSNSVFNPVSYQMNFTTTLDIVSFQYESFNSIQLIDSFII